MDRRISLAVIALLIVALCLHWAAAELLVGTQIVARLLSPQPELIVLLPVCFLLLRVVVFILVPGFLLIALGRLAVPSSVRKRAALVTKAVPD